MRETARTQLHPQGARRVEEALDDPHLDWSYLIGFAQYHGTLALLYTHLKERFPDRVPEQVLSTMRTLVLQRSVWSLTLTQELGRLMERCTEAGIQVLGLKGATLAQRFYGSLALRPFVDLDLLVRRQEYDRFESLLITEGYDRRELTPLQKATYLLVHAQYTFGRGLPTSYPITLDIHTGIVPIGYSYSASFEELWERSQGIEVGGSTVQTLGDEDLLIVLSYHGFKNRWDRFKYITDITEVIRALPHLNWDKVEALAAEMKCRRVLHLGLLLAHTLLDAAVPPAIVAAARKDRRVAGLHAEVIERLPEEAHIAVEPYWDRVRLNLYGQDDYAGRIRYGAYSLLRRMSEFVLPQET